MGLDIKIKGTNLETITNNNNNRSYLKRLQHFIFINKIGWLIPVFNLFILTYLLIPIVLKYYETINIHKIKNSNNSRLNIN